MEAFSTLASLPADSNNTIWLIVGVLAIIAILIWIVKGR